MGYLEDPRRIQERQKVAAQEAKATADRAASRKRQEEEDCRNAVLELCDKLEGLGLRRSRLHLLGPEGYRICWQEVFGPDANEHGWSSGGVNVYDFFYTLSGEIWFRSRGGMGDNKYHLWRDRHVYDLNSVVGNLTKALEAAVSQKS
ncbi:hypothetical protein EG829_27755 [bacterium]|nr:hypothetical protein [bacterium]